MNTNDAQRLGYFALQSWGFTREEAEQEALIALWEINRRGIKPKHLKAYLVNKLRNKQVDEWRKRKELQAEDYQIASLEADKPYDLSEFMRIIKPLPEDRRELLFFKYVSGYNEKDLAKTYSVSQGTIKSRLSRALDKLHG